MQNEPAFPALVSTIPNFSTSQGMTLRDYFASKAMQAMISHYGVEDSENAYYTASVEILTTKSYSVADAMLAERNKPQL